MLRSAALQNCGTCHVFRLQVVLSVVEHKPLADGSVCWTNIDTHINLSSNCFGVEGMKY
jgi:hypothetical protein